LKFIPLVWAGIWRKRGRSILILAQTLIAFTLFGVLQGLNVGIRHLVEKTHADRLYVSSKVSLAEPLPMSLAERIRPVPGVLAVAQRMQFGGIYQKPSQPVAITATDPATFFRMAPELQVTPAQGLTDLQNTLSGALVGADALRELGWKVGERVSVQTGVARKDGSRSWTFQIVGSIRNIEAPDQQQSGVIVNYRYVNEGRASGADRVGLFEILIDDPRHAAQIGHDIDQLFANSPNETLTQSEHELITSQLSRAADLDYIVHRITAAAFFVLLFATGALMMQSIRERTPELAVLKTVGYADSRVMLLILAETTALCLAGALLGLGIASRVLPLARNFIGIASISADVLLVGALIAIALALAAGSIPAWRGLRLRVADALADR